MCNSQCVYMLLWYLVQLGSSSSSYPPCSKRQGLNPHYRGFDVAPERDHANENTQDIYNVVSISGDFVDATSVSASVLVCFTSTGERLSDGWAFQKIGFGRCCRRKARGRSEDVHSFENKIARECATKV